ncbi:hypothetical protein [Gelidibacter salicanalis]|uniref:hypothetical protein n=1 Tax=Gelidibacter salicanalis TaxID=291193 RepID=UPI001FE8C131|nr:hypothetical protein [Gelidibacter salicanalis]
MTNFCMGQDVTEMPNFGVFAYPYVSVYITGFMYKEIAHYGCGVLGVRCEVLGVGCWVLGVGCWVLGEN